MSLRSKSAGTTHPNPVIGTPKLPPSPPRKNPAPCSAPAVPKEQGLRFLAKEAPPVVVRHFGRNALEISIDAPGQYLSVEPPGPGGHHVSARRVFLVLGGDAGEPSAEPACCCRRLAATCPGCKHLWVHHVEGKGCVFEHAGGEPCACPRLGASALESHLQAMLDRYPGRNWRILNASPWVEAWFTRARALLGGARPG